MSVLVPMLWADHSRCDLEFEDWSEIFENQTEGPTMTDWNQSLSGRPSEPGARYSFLPPPSEDEEDDEEVDDEEDEDEGLTAETRSLPIPYRLVWMDEWSEGPTGDRDPGSSPSGTTRGSGPEGPGTLDALEVLEGEQEAPDDTRW